MQSLAAMNNPSLLRIAHASYTLLVIAMNFISLNPKESPLNDTFVLSFRLDYIVHFLVFFLWASLTRAAYRPHFSQNFSRAVLWVAAGLLLAVVSEGLQLFIPYRSFNINDIVANTIAVLIGSLLFIYYPNKFVKKNA